MGRSIRYWFRNIEETIVISVIVLGVLILLQPILWESGIQINGAGFLLAVIQSVCMVSISMQSLQIMSISIIFGDTRKDSLKAMHLAMLTGLVQLELIQVVLYLVPVMDKNLQFIAICYTPVLFFFGTGLSYIVSWFQTRSEKAYKIIFTVFCLGIGGVMGFTGAASGDLLDKLGGQWIRETLDGMVLVICAVVAVVVYVAGVVVHNWTVRNMDVRI